MGVALSLRTSRLARDVWNTEVQSFVAGARWIPVPGGRAIIHPQLPEVWDASFVAHVSDPPDVRALVDASTRVLRAAGCGHVKLLVDDAGQFPTTGSSLRRLGLGERAYVTMSTRRVPPPAPARGEVVVHAVTTRRERGAMARVRDAVRRESSWYAPEVSRALDAWEDLQAATLDLTWLCAFLDGEPAGAVGLLVAEGGASLQSLATVPRLRHRGVASALVREVVRRGLARGAPWVSLLTDRDDTPRHLYRALGFREVGEVREYLRALG